MTVWSPRNNYFFFKRGIKIKKVSDLHLMRLMVDDSINTLEDLDLRLVHYCWRVKHQDVIPFASIFWNVGAFQVSP